MVAISASDTGDSAALQAPANVNIVMKKMQGKVLFGGKDITGREPHLNARDGMTRTFQIVRPLKKMTVLDNVLTAALVLWRHWSRLVDAYRGCDWRLRREQRRSASARA